MAPSLIDSFHPMSELRKDPIVGHWVILAEDRAGRPYEFQSSLVHRSDQTCPFCEGHEEQTPPELVAFRAPGSPADGPGWRVRVVPNKFPALSLTENCQPQAEGLYQRMPGLGAHEVIIESPKHLVSTAALEVTQFADILSVYRQRLLVHKQDPRLACGMIFKNLGPAAGASLEHIHSQLIVTPMVPITVEKELSGSHEYHRRHGRCVYCDMIEQELKSAARIVIDQPEFIAFTPFASRFPFETWILPKIHGSHFENLEARQIDELAGIFKSVLAKTEAAVDRPAYNYIIHTAPFDTQALEHYHWHVEVMPSLIKPAGFEWGTGCYINPLSPEEAALRLRNITLPIT